ncbi:hypothetical protein JXR93_12250 [bacterium]|nr:hypothetical protein [bacterium]
MRIVVYFLFVLTFLGCGDSNNNNQTQTCSPECSEWEECNDGACVLKAGRCNTSSNCLTSQICNTETHACEEPTIDPCEDVTCSNHGECQNSNGVASCSCDDGYKANGLDCVLLCSDVSCSGGRVCNPSNGECVCQEGSFYNGLTEKCELDDDCTDVTCDTNSYCLEGECYLKDECSIENPDGVCPAIDGIILTCKDGICISTNDGSKKEAERCMPSEFDCEEGTICADVFKDGFYKCRAFCDMTTEGSCGEKGICVPYLDDILLNTGICVKEDAECQSNATAQCPENWVCDLMITAKVCRPVGLGKYGDDCDNMDSTSALDACEVGLFCVGDDDDGEPYKCQELCSPLAQTDNCEIGRCIALEDVSPAVLNREIGLCMDVPSFCNSENGIQNNPACPNEALCFPAGDNSICVQDECEIGGDDCEEGLACQKGYMSVNKCLPVGILDYQDSGCVNPEFNENVTYNPEELCKEGLFCISANQGERGTCQELCDPTSENSCVNDPSLRCIDINTYAQEYPEGLNGVCFNLPETCNPDNGIYNNSTCEGEDSICFPLTANQGICDVDQCSPENSNECIDGKGCTLSVTSKYHCLEYGTLPKNSEGCVNPEYQIGVPYSTETLCEEGFYCIGAQNQERCQEMCIPNGEPCSRGICVDVHTMQQQVPAGVIGVCLSL